MAVEVVVLQAQGAKRPFDLMVFMMRVEFTPLLLGECQYFGVNDTTQCIARYRQLASWMDIGNKMVPRYASSLNVTCRIISEAAVHTLLGARGVYLFTGPSGSCFKSLSNLNLPYSHHSFSS
jgi:hypothetical protein